MAGEKYIAAIRDGAGALPFLIPSLDPPLDPEHLLAHVDGLLLTGSASNVDPAYYGGVEPRSGNLADAHRDATTLPLIRAAIAAGRPCLFICRGHQELNVAFGGTLFQHVREVPGRFDHSDDAKQGIEAKYAPAHEVTVQPGGVLETLLERRRFAVNSLHGQAIDRLAHGLRIEAVADDGTIEAISVAQAPGFTLSVQWHPEWQWSQNPESRSLFAAFGRALSRRQ
jgi:putative glutamine amidotransferase